MDSSRRQSAADSVSGSSLSNDRRPIVPLSDWQEPYWPEFLFTDQHRDDSQNLEPSQIIEPAQTNWARRLLPGPPPRRRYRLFGFSPNCRRAFLLQKRSVDIYALGEPPQVRAEHRERLSIEEHDSPEGQVLDAVLSNRYFATVDRYKLDTFQLRADGSLGRHCHKALENQAKGSNWVPQCLTIFDEDEDKTWVAVGFLVKKGGRPGGDIKIYVVKETGITEEIGRHDKVFRSTIATPLESEYIRKISFSPDGDRLACVTSNNTVLVWSWSQRGSRWRYPFDIQRRLIPGTGGGGTLTSVALFQSPSRKPYVVCTTSPSSERRYGEWSFISPVPNGPAEVPMELENSIQQLHESFLVGAVTSVGDLMAVLEASGRVRLLALDRGTDGGVCCLTSEIAALKINERLSPQESAPLTSLRFQGSSRGLYLFALDLHGKLIVKPVTRGQYPPPTLFIPPGPHLLSSSTSVVELAGTEFSMAGNRIIQLPDSEAPNRNAPPSDPRPARASTWRAQGEARQTPFRTPSLP